jgi:hypothetical protein
MSVVMVLQSTTGEGPSSDSGVESTGDGSRTGTPTSFANNYTGILTLVNQQRVSARTLVSVQETSVCITNIPDLELSKGTGLLDRFIMVFFSVVSGSYWNKPQLFAWFLSILLSLEIIMNLPWYMKFGITNLLNWRLQASVMWYQAV